MKPWKKWLAGAVLLSLISAGVLRTLMARRAQEAAVAMQSSRHEAPALELTVRDLVALRTVTLTQTLPVSGTVRAVNTAWVKARVAGEIQGLSVREGDVVRAGQVLAHIDPTDAQARLRQAREQSASALAQVQIAQRNLDNNEGLVTQGFISKTALESSRATLAAAQANYRAAVAGVDQLVKGLDDTVLRAPIAGLISQRTAQNGERLGIDARIAEIVDLGQLELEASLTVTDAVALRVGQVASLQMDEPGPDGGLVLQSKVLRINPSAAVGSRSITAYLSLPAQTGLRQGLYLQGEVIVGNVTALALPLNAVRMDKPQPYVQVIAGQKVVHQTVALGPQGKLKGQAMVVVQASAGGLPDGALVLAESVGYLPAGTAVVLPDALKGSH